VRGWSQCGAEAVAAWLWQQLLPRAVVEAEPLGRALDLAFQWLSVGEQAIKLGLVARVGGGLHPCEGGHLLIEVAEPGVQLVIVAGGTMERLQV